GSSPSARARGERGCTSTVRCSSRDRRLCSAASRGRRPPDIAQALRPTLTTVRGSAIPIFVAPAEAGVQTFARLPEPLFGLDPGLRRDDNGFESRLIQSARLFAMMYHRPSSLRRRPESRPCAHGAPPLCPDPGLRRDDKVFEARQTQSARLFVMM